MLVTSAVFFVLALIALMVQSTPLAMGAMVVSQSLFYIFVGLALIYSFLHLSKRRKTKKGTG